MKQQDGKEPGKELGARWYKGAWAGSFELERHQGRNTNREGEKINEKCFSCTLVNPSKQRSRVMYTTCAKGKGKREKLTASLAR